MNFSFHIFGNPSGKFCQYPADNTCDTNQFYADSLLGRRMVITRRDKLIVYRYYCLLSDEKYIGFAVSCNSAQFSKIKELMRLFDEAVNYMINSGIILRCDSRGNIDFHNNFHSSVFECEEVEEFIAFRLNRSPEIYGYGDLKGFPEKGTKTVNTQLTDDALEALTYKFDTVIINHATSKPVSYLRSMIVSLNEELTEAHDTNQELLGDNQKLNRQKKQFKFVLLLLLLLLGAGLWLFSMRGNLSRTQDNLSSTQRNLFTANNEIVRLKEDSTNMEINLSENRAELSNTRRRLNDAHNEIARLQDTTSIQRGQINELTASLRASNDIIIKYNQLKGLVSNLHRYSTLPDWYSSNHSHNSTSSYQYGFYGYAGDVLSFDYYVDSEGCDYLRYSLNGPMSKDGQWAGQSQSGSRSITLTSTGYYTLTVSYSKDSSVSSHSDRGRFTNIKVERGDVAKAMRGIYR